MFLASERGLNDGAGNEIRTRDLNLGKSGFVYDYLQLPKCPYYLTGNAFSLIIVYKIEYVKSLVAPIVPPV